MSLPDLSSGSSVSSAKRFGLDDTDKRDILVYKYRRNLQVSSQEKLCKELDNEPGFRCAKKPIPRNNCRVEIQHGDLFPEDEKSRWQDKPNFKTSLASIMLPFGIRLKRLLFDKYQQLYIVSPETSPDNTPESSKHTSPTNSFPRESTPGA